MYCPYLKNTIINKTNKKLVKCEDIMNAIKKIVIIVYVFTFIFTFMVSCDNRKVDDSNIYSINNQSDGDENLNSGNISGIESDDKKSNIVISDNKDSNIFNSLSEKQNSKNSNSIISSSIYSNSSIIPVEEKIEKILPLQLPSEISLVKDIENFTNQGLDPKGHYTTGISISPYYNVKIKNVIVPTYCVPVTLGGPHNFAMIDVTSDQYPLSITINTTYVINATKVIPERYNVIPSVSNNQVKFNIAKPGKYTVIFNNSHEKPLTVIVRENKKTPQQDGYKVITYEKGIHYVDFIDITSNTILYLKSGALLIPKQPQDSETPIKNPDWAGKKKYRPFIQMKDAFNVKIVGSGVIDFTTLDWHMRVPIEIMNCKNVEIEGVTLINAPEWNLTSWYSQNVKIKDVIIFGYRQNSDGIEIVNSQDVVVEDCFARSGDDLFGVKSMNVNSLVGGKNIYFNNCIAWPDKVRGFGVLHETVSDISNVYFTGCSVLYKFSNWMDELGSLAIIASGKGNVSQIYFKDIEIFYEIRYPIICSFIKDDSIIDTTSGSIRNIYFENIRYNGTPQIRLKGQDNTSKLDYIYFKDIFKNGNKINTIGALNLSKNEFVGDNIILQ